MTATWRILADRRHDPEAPARIRQELARWLPGIEGLQITWIEDDPTHADQGAFRDFVPIVSLSHESLQVLEYVGEEAIDQFGWRVDLEKR